MMKPLAYIHNYTTLSSLGNRNVLVDNIVSNTATFSPFKINEGMQTIVFNCASDLEMDQLPPTYRSRNNLIAYTAIKPLIGQIEQLKTKYSKKRIGIVVGTSTSGIDHLFAQLDYSQFKLPLDYNYSLQEMGNLSAFLTKLLDIEGIAYTISTACSSSARAFIEGCELIQSNICDAVIIGGCDTLNPLTIHGFHSLGALSKTRANPFSLNRDGINIGEGVAFFILSKEEAELGLLGYGQSSDGYHSSSPCPNGSGARIAIKQALAMACLNPNEIDYINLHGTGTPKNDQMESLVTSDLFGSETYCSSTKSLTGHTLGAAGAIEASITCEALLKSVYPTHYYDGFYDDKNPLINLKTPPNKAPRICMSNSYAFGGNNASLIFGRNV
jgi:3-oxoacyl-[acyl-carrier-protein] synthase I